MSNLTAVGWFLAGALCSCVLLGALAGYLYAKWVNARKKAPMSFLGGMLRALPLAVRGNPLGVLIPNGVHFLPVRFELLAQQIEGLQFFYASIPAVPPEGTPSAWDAEEGYEVRQ